LLLVTGVILQRIEQALRRPFLAHGLQIHPTNQSIARCGDVAGTP